MKYWRYQDKIFYLSKAPSFLFDPTLQEVGDVRLTDRPCFAGRRSNQLPVQCMAKDKGHTHHTARDSERDSTEQASASKHHRTNPGRLPLNLTSSLSLLTLHHHHYLGLTLGRKSLQSIALKRDQSIQHPYTFTGLTVD